MKIKRLGHLFTGRGIAFFLFSGLIVGAGIFRMDLAALLWGSAFFLLSFYTFLGNILQKIIVERFLKGRPEAFDIAFPEGGYFPGERANIKVKIELPSLIIPGFGLDFIGKLSFGSNPDPITLKQELQRGNNDFYIEMQVNKRGLYRTKDICIICSDFLHFTQTRVNFEINEYLRVYPKIYEKNENLMFMEGGGDTREYLNRRKRSNELLEVRKYFPGDDLRKLNWKIYAHLGELFLRIGEEKLQTKARIVFILDNSVSEHKIDFRRKIGYATKKIISNYLDDTVTAFGSMVVALLREGIIVSVMIGHTMREFSSEDIEKLLSLLSEVEWEQGNATGDYALKAEMHGVIVTTPLSGAIDRIVRSLKARKCKISLYIKDFQLSETRQFRWRDLVFRNIQYHEIMDRSKVQTDIASLSNLADSMVESFKSVPWRLKDVRKI